MRATKSATRACIWGLGLLLAAACGPTEPAKKKDWMDGLKQQNPNAEPDLSGADDDPEPAPKPAPETKPDTKIKPQTGRPLIQYGPKSSIESTFGVTPGSKLMLTGGYTLILPEGALDGGYNIVWKNADSRAPKKGNVTGGIAMMKVNPGTKVKSKKVKTRGAPFEIRVEHGADKSLNLAIGEVATDKNGIEVGKPAWTVVAPARVDKPVTVGEAAPAQHTSIFELPTIGPILYLHATTDGPS